MAQNYVNKTQIKVGNSTTTYIVEPTLYSAASTSDSGGTYTASLDNFGLVTGATVQIKFAATNKASATLNVNSTGAKTIFYNGAAIVASTLKANHTYTLSYDGTQWQLVGDIDTNTNTTYTFANGTNGFTVTPSGGSAQTVTVTPSITNNITGSGTSNKLVKFTGTNTIGDSGLTTDTSNNLSVPGSIFFGKASTNKAVLAYDSSNTKFGIWYHEGNPDVMRFSASGNADSNTTADFAINALGTGILSNRNNYIPHTGNTTGTVGSDSQPVYVNAGTITSIDKQKTANALINALDTGSSDLTSNDYVITQYVGGGTTTTSYHRRPASKVINATLVKAALGTVSTTAKKFLKDTGSWAQVDWEDLTSKPSTFSPSAHTHYELVTIGDKRTENTTPNTYVSRIIFQGLKANNYINSPYTDTYSYLVGLRGWGDSSGGNSHELAFNGNGIYRRQGATTTWGNWFHILDSNNTSSGTDNTATLTWNTTYIIAKINGTDIKFTTMTKPSYAFADLTAHPTTLSGYGITDAKIASGVITLGSNTITPVTSVNGHTGSSVSVTASDLGLSTAMHFIGVATVAITDGSTTDPVISGYSTKTAGDVIIDKDSSREYVWSTTNKWELLGGDSSYKTTQSTVDSGAAVTNKWVSRIQQNANGVVTVTMGTLDTSGTWGGNAATATAATRLNSNTTVSTKSGLQYTVGQLTIGTADGNAKEGSNNSSALWSYPTGGTAINSNTTANIQNLRLYWSSDGKYFRDIFISPNNSKIYHRAVANGTAGNWYIVLDSNNTASGTNNAATLTWNTTYTIAKINDTDIKFTTMAKPTAADIGAAPAVTGGYLPLSGGTMTGVITASTGNQKGIKIGNTYITAIDGSIIFQNNAAIRFGTNDWDWNKWAGLKYEATNKIIYLGLADGDVFNANNGQSNGTLRFPGINKVVLTANSGGLYKYYGSASTAPTIQVNSNNLDVSILKIDGNNPTDVRDSQSYGFNLKYMGTGGGAGNTLRLIADNSDGTDITAMEISGDGKVGIGTTYNTNYKLYVNDATYINGATTSYGTIFASNGLLKSKLNGKTVEIGSQNSSWCHIQTDASAFYFKPGISIDGDCSPYTDNSRSLGASNKRWASIYATEFIGNIRANKLIATVSKTYSDNSFYGTSDAEATCSKFFISVKPDSWYKPWQIRFKVRTYAPAHTNADSVTWCTLNGRADSIIYANWNERYDIGHYYVVVRVLKNAGFQAGLGHAVGVNIRYSTGRGNSEYYKTIELEYYDCSGCTVTVLDNAVLWSSWSNGNDTNYNGYSNLDAVNRGLRENGDDNDTTTIQSYYDRVMAGTNGIMQYSLAMRDSVGRWQSFTTTNGVGTTKTKNTVGFVLGEILYMSTGGNITNGNITGWGVCRHFQGLIDYRYSTNAGNTLDGNATLYIVGQMGTDGLFYLNDTWWATSLPTQNSNNIYIPIGVIYPDGANKTYRCDFSGWHTPLWYHNGNLRSYEDSATYIEGTNDAQNPGGALLRSGSGRADNSTTGDTWIFWDTLGGTSSYWGFKHSQGDNSIKFYGGGNLRSTIHLGESKITADTFDGNATSASSVARATFGNNNNGEHDADNITSNGLWYYSSHGPATTLGASTTDGALYSQAYSTSWVGQIAQDYRDGQLFVRGKNNGTWKSWYCVPKFTTSTGGIGGTTTPIYIDTNGEIQTCTAYGSASVNYATSAGSAGSATSAGKATNDSDGNAINTTYLKIANGIQYFNNHDKNIDTLTTTPYLQTAQYAGGNWSGTKPTGSHNGLALFNFQTHSGNYYSQLALDTNQNKIWMRSNNNGSTYGSWEKVAYTSDIPTNLNQLTNGPGYTTNTGTVTSITLVQGAGISLDTNNTAITTSGSRTISISGMNTSSGDDTKCLTQKGNWVSFNNYSLPIAKNNTLGGVKPWYSHTKDSTGPTTGSDANAIAVNAIQTTAGRYYAIESDNSGRLFVNVPWTNVNNSYLTSHNNLVKQTAKSDNVKYKLLASAQASPTSGTAYEAVYDVKVYVNPSLNTLNAGGFVIHDKASTPVEKVKMQWNATDLSLDFVFI